MEARGKGASRCGHSLQFAFFDRVELRSHVVLELGISPAVVKHEEEEPDEESEATHEAGNDED